MSEFVWELNDAGLAMKTDHDASYANSNMTKISFDAAPIDANIH